MRQSIRRELSLLGDLCSKAPSCSTEKLLCQQPRGAKGLYPQIASSFRKVHDASDICDKKHLHRHWSSTHQPQPPNSWNLRITTSARWCVLQSTLVNCACSVKLGNPTTNHHPSAMFFQSNGSGAANCRPDHEGGLQFRIQSFDCAKWRYTSWPQHHFVLWIIRPTNVENDVPKIGRCLLVQLRSASSPWPNLKNPAHLEKSNPQNQQWRKSNPKSQICLGPNNPDSEDSTERRIVTSTFIRRINFSSVYYISIVYIYNMLLKF